MIQFTRHYTGIEIADYSLRCALARWLCVQLYVERDPGTRRVTFVRLSGWHWMLGLFVGRTNYVHFHGSGGFELFTTHLHLGWSCKPRAAKRIDWHGSSRDPWHAYTLNVGRFGIGSTTDKWIVRIMQRRAKAECARMDAYYDEQVNQQS